MVIEHNGDIYSCDHFVDPDHLLGNIMTNPVRELVNSPGQWQFGRDKQDGLPGYCQKCGPLCLPGEIPKNRFTRTPDGDTGLNYLCEGYKLFFGHISEPMKFMVQELRAGRAPANVMKVMKEIPSQGD